MAHPRHVIAARQVAVWEEEHFTVAGAVLCVLLRPLRLLPLWLLALIDALAEELTHHKHTNS